MALVFAHPAFGGHVTPPGHPERVDRLRAVEAGLQGLALTRSEAPMALLDAVTRCHPRAYADRVAGAVPREGWAQLDGDTYLSPGSLEAALRAVGGAGAAVDAALAAPFYVRDKVALDSGEQAALRAGAARLRSMTPSGVAR